MIISRISEQIKNQDRVNIFVDGKYSFSLTIGQLLDEKLKAGTNLDDASLKRLKKLSADGKMKARAINWLMRRPHSAKEVNDYLKRHGVDETMAAAWLADFQSMDLQNDKQFSQWWVEQRRSKQRSHRYIANELRSKGVAASIIESVLIEGAATDKDALKALIAKKRRNARYQDERKLIEYLLRQGYRYDDITELLAE